MAASVAPRTCSKQGTLRSERMCHWGFPAPLLHAGSCSTPPLVSPRLGRAQCVSGKVCTSLSFPGIFRDVSLFLSASLSTSYVRQHILSDEYYLMPNSLGKINRLIKKKKQARPSLISPNKMKMCEIYTNSSNLKKKKKKVCWLGSSRLPFPNGVVPISCCRIKQRCCIRKVELLDERTARVCLSNLTTHWTGDTVLCPWVVCHCTGERAQMQSQS